MEPTKSPVEPTTGEPRISQSKRKNSASFLPTESNAVEEEFKPLKVFNHSLTEQAFSAYSQVHGPQAIDLRISLVLLVLAVLVRCFKIDNPNEIVFDEVHFGGTLLISYISGFASKYISSEYFFDVHPPLGKLIIAFSGVLAGYNGTFAFESIGLSYATGNVPYVALRLVPALFGVLLSPMAYATMRNFGFSSIAAIMAGVFVIFENGLACQSRLILLDSFLVFFTGLTALMWSEFCRFKNQPFSVGWWRMLTFVGISLGLTASVKWVGLFTIATIGFSTIVQLWGLVSDGSIPIKLVVRHFFARVTTLAVVPILVYMTFFQVHFALLSKMGPGSNFMSPEFQATLSGSPIIESHTDVAYGSTIIFRHEGSKGGYLHSHLATYPGGSKQQQVTCYPFKDLNSDFLVKKPLVLGPLAADGAKTVIEQEIIGFDRIHHLSEIRLQHVPTGARLHSHAVRPGFNDDKEINEVSAYGTEKVMGDTNDHWVVEIIGANDESVQFEAINQQFRLRHRETGCYLSSREQKLPDWAFGQQEVYCSSKSRYKLTLWRIEGSSHEEMPADSKKIRYHKQGFLEKFIELHGVMWTANNNLKATHPYGSTPGEWPLLKRGISFWKWGNKLDTGNAAIYLIGNPIVWIPGFLSIGLFLAFQSVELILQKRKIFISRSGYFKDMITGCEFYVTGYLLHYLPFFLMGRQLFLHHYLPALYFSILASCATFDLLTFKLKNLGQMVLGSLAILAVVYAFYLLSPLTFGLAQTKLACQALKLRKGWDFVC